MRQLLLMGLLACASVSHAGLLVTDIGGSAEIDGKGPVTILAEIPDGAQMTLAAGARLVAVDLASGNEYLLQGRASYVITSEGPKTADGKPVQKKSLPVRNLPAVRIANTRAAQATLVMRSMRKFNTPLLHMPVRTVVISATPTFQWGAVEGARTYRLLLREREGRSVVEIMVPATEYALSATHSLTPGQDYSWRIEALDDADMVISDASANFTMASAEVVARMAELRPAAGASFGRRVLYAAQLREVGAVAEARQHWEALARERPDDAVLKMLAQ